MVTRFPTFRSLSKSGAIGKWSMAMKTVLRTMQMVMPRSTKGSVTITRRMDLTFRQQPQQFHCRRTVAKEYQHGGQDLWSSSKSGEDNDFQRSKVRLVYRLLLLYLLCLLTPLSLPVPSPAFLLHPLCSSSSPHSSCNHYPPPPATSSTAQFLPLSFLLSNMCTIYSCAFMFLDLAVRRRLAVQKCCSAGRLLYNKSKDQN